MHEFFIPSLYILSGICTYAGFTHFFAGIRQPLDFTQLVFSAMCLAILMFSLTNILCFQTENLAEYIPRLKWNLAYYDLFYVLLIWFIALYTGQFPWPWLIGMSAILALVFFVNLVQPFSVQFAHISTLRQFRLPWGEAITLAVGRTSPWLSLGLADIAAVLGYSLYALSRVYRRTRSRYALSMIVAVGFVAVCIVEGALVRLAVIDLVPIGAYGILGMVTVMTVALNLETQKRLRTSEIRFRSLVEQSPISIQLLSVEGRTLRVNAAWEKLWGLKAEALANYNILQDRQLIEKGSMPAIQQAFAGQPARLDPLIYNPADNPVAPGPPSTHWISAYIYPIKNDEGTIQEVVLLHEDITEQIHLEENLAKAKTDAETANQAKSAFLANMSHEIRTPLNGILGMAQMIRVNENDKILAQQGETIANAAKHLLSIVNDILDLSKIEANKFILEYADFNLHLAVDMVTAIIREDAKNKGLAVTAEIDPSLPSILRGDAVRIRQMLLNLCVNAVKFTHKGSVSISIQGLEALGEKINVRFSVQDTGIGISPENHSRLFGNFEQIDNQFTRKHGGSGLGLAICKRLAVLMEGQIGFNSTLGVGSTFWFDLPLTKGSVAALPTFNWLNATEYLKRMAHNNSQIRLLLVEDNPLNQTVARELLANVGMTAELAENGEEAVSLASLRKYDLILMDIQMPKMDGLEATRQIRRLHQGNNIPILAMTANAYAEDRTLCNEAGMDGHIAKPIVMEEFYASLLRWLYPGEFDRASETPQASNPPPLPVPQDNALENLAKLSGFDPDKGIGNVAGKVATYLKLLLKFAERQPADMASLQSALAEGDLATAKRIAHTLKGLAGTLGAVMLQAHSIRLDEAFRDQLGAEEIANLTRVVIAEYASLSAQILAALDPP